MLERSDTVSVGYTHILVSAQCDVLKEPRTHIVCARANQNSALLLQLFLSTQLKATCASHYYC
jgi:hypothetical protein